jgi:glycosyltransferase involved in cell wall biosynthesis
MTGGGIVEEGFSGGDRIAVESIKRLKDHRQIHVFIGKAGYGSYKRYGVSDVKWHFTSSYTSLRNRLVHILLFSLQALLIGLLSAASVERTKEKSIVYCSDFLPEILPAIVLKKRLRSRMVCGFYLFTPNPFQHRIHRDLQFSRALLLWLAQRISYPLARKYADIVFVTNKIDRRKFLDGRLTEGRVLAVEGGVDMRTTRLVPDPLRKSFEAVFVGRLHPQKGVIQLIDIWKYVSEALPKATLCIIGTGQLEASLRVKIDQYGLQENVKLLGFLDGIEKIKVFKASKVVVHPAIYESGGMAASEAMACGLPGVSFDLEVLRDYYPKGMLKTPCYNLSAFADNIVQLLRDEELYRNVSKQAIELASERDWDRKAEENLRFIEQEL